MKFKSETQAYASDSGRDSMAAAVLAEQNENRKAAPRTKSTTILSAYPKSRRGALHCDEEQGEAAVYSRIGEDISDIG